MTEALDIPGTRVEGCSRFALERLRAGELDEAAASRLQAHVGSCERCGETWRSLEERQTRFGQSIPFERLEQAVRARQRPVRRRYATWGFGAGFALAATIALVIRMQAPSPEIVSTHSSRNGLKGSDTVELYVGGAGETSRLAQDGEQLAPGERVRISYQTTDKHFVMVLSVDETGEVTSIYPEQGHSLPVEPGVGPHLLPDSVEFTGHGVERVITLLSDAPLDTETARAAALKAFSQASSVDAMSALDLPAEELSRLVRKP